MNGKDLHMVLQGETFGKVEDCVGAGVLLQIAKAFKKKSGKAYKEYCDWLGIMELDLSTFDTGEMNRELKNTSYFCKYL